MLEDIKMGSGTTEQDERKLQTARASYREGLAFGFCAKPHSYHPGGQRPMLVWVWRCQHPEHVDSVDVTAETHMKAKIREVITTDTCPIDSRALSVGWVAWFGFPCYGPRSAGCGSDVPKKNREVALARSPRPACCARLLWANQTHIRLSLAVPVGRRTEMHQTAPRL